MLTKADEIRMFDTALRVLLRYSRYLCHMETKVTGVHHKQKSLIFLLCSSVAQSQVNKKTHHGIYMLVPDCFHASLPKKVYQ